MVKMIIHGWATLFLLSWENKYFTLTGEGKVYPCHVLFVRSSISTSQQPSWVSDTPPTIHTMPSTATELQEPYLHKVYTTIIRQERCSSTQFNWLLSTPIRQQVLIQKHYIQEGDSSHPIRVSLNYHAPWSPGHIKCSIHVSIPCRKRRSEVHSHWLPLKLLPSKMIL